MDVCYTNLKSNCNSAVIFLNEKKGTGRKILQKTIQNVTFSYINALTITS